MAEPITIKKKKKLTIKSKSAAAESAAAPEEANPEVVLPGITPSAAASKPAANYTVYAILAALATAMFIGIITIQWIEWTYLQPAFPHPIPTPGM
jgi:hypothetical protein